MNWLTQPLERVFLRPLRSLGGLSFDVVVSEEHEDTLTIAKHPVEQGANISDHAYRNPCKVVIRGASSESTYGLPVWDPYNATLYNALLALQNEPIMITGALISNYLDLYRVLLGRRSRRGLGDVAKDFGYKGNWNYRLNSTEKTALRFKRAQLEDCLHILQGLDTDLKSSKLDADLLMQKALCELALAGRA
mgnify:FL=1